VDIYFDHGIMDWENIMPAGVVCLIAVCERDDVVWQLAVTIIFPVCRMSLDGTTAGIE
jgi:hypothetical protein